MVGSERIISPDTLREDRIPPGQRKTLDFPVLHHGPVPQIDPKDWSFRLFGMVKEEVVLDHHGFMSLPRVEVVSDIHCVTRWSRLDNLWEGVASKDLRDLVDIDPRAKFVIVHGYGGFTTNLRFDDLFQEDVVFAIKHDGVPLTMAHGGPVRLVVPRLYFWKSTKWVTGVEFMDLEYPGFWEERGYHIHGDPWREQRRDLNKSR